MMNERKKSNMTQDGHVLLYIYIYHGINNTQRNKKIHPIQPFVSLQLKMKNNSLMYMKKLVS